MWEMVVGLIGDLVNVPLMIIIIGTYHINDHSSG
jgi:hypothetical protein